MEFVSPPPVLGRFVARWGNGGGSSANNFCSSFRIGGISGASITWLNPTSVSATAGGASINGDGITINAGTTWTSGSEVTVDTLNAIQYDAYCILPMTGGSSTTPLEEFSGFTIINLTDGQDVVDAVNKVADGYKTVAVDATGSSVDLELDSDAVQTADTTSNSVTFVLPSVADTGSNGKTFIFRLEDATNDLIIDGEGAELVGGEATQTLSDQGEVMCIQCDGTEWNILYHNAERGLLPSYTTTERDALTARAGLTIFNSTTSKLNFYNGSAWEAVTSA
jgi:hypothetical protein